MFLVAKLGGHLRRHVVAYLALFLALAGGTAIALPGRNSVDSGDIRPRAVHTSDLAKGAVKAAKIAPGAVDSARVRDDSLTGADIDESTLRGVTPAPGSVGPLEEADRVRRILIPAGSLVPNPNAQQSSQSSFATVDLPPEKDSSAHVSLEVPGGRIPGTALQVRLFWDANGEGSVLWELAYQSAGVGQSTIGAPTVLTTVATTTSNVANVTAFDIPAAAVHNGDLLGLRIGRNVDDPADTLPVFARLMLVELRYTSGD